MKVNTNNVLDQYFTKQDVATALYKKTCDIISSYENLADINWIEPSAGNGVFFNLLPKNKRIGIDINPLNNEIIECDYLKYRLPINKKNIVIGNPPFGHRGVMALKFINHSKNADYVCFILPMFFESKGKGSIKYRVNGFNLIHSERLKENAFFNPNNNKSVDVKCVFQIWSKNHKIENEEFSWYKHKGNEPFGDLLKVFTVSLAKKRECGKKWIYEEKADYYLSSTFHTNISVVNTFEEVKYKSGVAIVLTAKDESKRKKIKTLLENVDWTKYGSLATNSCYHIGKSNIFSLIQDNFSNIK
ncbi:MAG: SAM-dependent methyltransferase [Sphingobacteriales bacterium]|nr:MAG: SAM-dependent methyltransferase [Sphingobacteriales bacterium]TAF81710.1 MAG: SAM-dependent methyltransferase [Sphingobacteriales bacterium]